jgi:hypothetical protein
MRLYKYFIFVIDLEETATLQSFVFTFFSEKKNAIRLQTKPSAFFVGEERRGKAVAVSRPCLMLIFHILSEAFLLLIQ